MARPEHLPDFDSPPLDEVVLGVQFSPIGGYSSVFARDVWDLFKEQFPGVQEQPPLEPSFETFGGSAPRPGMELRFGPPPLRGRLWFLSKDQNHLIQFQEDRLLLNWRKRPNGQGYPRFEGIAASFEQYLNKLQGFFEAAFGTRLDINQSEVSYINVVPVESYSEAGKWFRVLDLESINSETVSLLCNEVVHDLSGKPYARLIHELHSVVTVDRRVKALRFALSFRGKPAGNDIRAAIAFVRQGREKIVTRFSDLTTDEAHVNWNRKK